MGKLQDGGRRTGKKGISNIHRKVSCGEQGISNDEVRFFAALRADKVSFDIRIFLVKNLVDFPSTAW